MSRSKEEALRNIRKKLEKNLLLRYEINNPYFEKYVDEAIEAVVNEIFNAIEDHHNKFIRDLNDAARRGF
jgi:hypothetical protein